MVYYDQQGNEVDPPEAEPVPETNYDRLISSTPEEMAKIIRPWCPHEQTGCVHLYDKTDCGQCRLDWLRSPAEEGET
jgi:hypothetical protein